MQSYRVTGLLALTIFLSGAGTAAMTPFRSIVGVDALGMSNAAFGSVMALNAAGSAAVAVALGWLSDRLQDRRLLVLLCAMVGVLAFGLVWAVRSPWVFVASFALLVPFGNALFSQSFSYSRAYLDRDDPDRAEFFVSLLRSGFTLAWIVMPPVAGWIAAQSSAYAAFGVAAAAYAGCTLAIGLLRLESRARVGRPGADASGKATAPAAPVRIATDRLFGIAGVTAALAALQLNMVLLPLVILRDLGGTLAEVGIVSAVGAAIEVPVMIGWGYVALRVGKEAILAIASVTLALYLALMALVTGFAQVLALQGIAAVAIAALLSINISYLQEAIPGRIGLATSLVDVTRVISVSLAAAVFALNRADSYAPSMVVAAALAVLGGLLMLVARRLRRVGGNG